MSFSPLVAADLRTTIDKTTSGSHPTIVGTATVNIDRDGKEIFTHAAGRLGLSSPQSVDLDTVFWIASCTKMIMGLASMQLVEKGILALDDSAQLEDLCPELKTLQVVKKDGALEPKRKGITLRMLLTHTAGFSYSFFNEEVRNWSYPVGLDEFSGDFKDMLQPLVFQPGEGWEYGINIDWAGIALERATGLKLNDYIQKHICEPLGLKNTNMIPTKTMKEKLAHMHQKQLDGTLIPRDHLMRNILRAETKEEVARLFHSGGGGMFSTPREYCRILAVLLNNGVCPATNMRLLSASTVDTMFTNQIPSMPNFGQQGIPAAKPDLTNPLPLLYPVHAPAPQQGWGLIFMIAGGPTGRSTGTGHWAGLSNCYWWCDREKGVAGMLCAQTLPFADMSVLVLRDQVEEGVYRGLQKGVSNGKLNTSQM